jgi:23S rRNA pseudouridine1911/1915/1917 synthase
MAGEPTIPAVAPGLARAPGLRDTAGPMEELDESDSGEAVELILIPLEVDPARGGMRLDRFIGGRIARLSRTRIQEIIGAGRVRCASSGAPLLRASQRVRVGQRLIIERPAPREPAVVLDYSVIFEDAELLVLNKPAGLPVHPSASYHRHTLTHLLRVRLGADHGWELAHRLDRETSGVLVLGRRGGGSGRALKQAFLGRAVEKLYWALVHGEVTGPLRVDLPLGPALGSQIRVKMGPRALADGGLAALTAVTPLPSAAALSFRGRPISLVAAAPFTGRQHQIRVHLAEIGHPVLGDKLYGVEEEAFIAVAEGRRSLDDLGRELGLLRHALHARSLTLAHPRSGEVMTFVAPWPEDLAAIAPAPREVL